MLCFGPEAQEDAAAVAFGAWTQGHRCLQDGAHPQGERDGELSPAAAGQGPAFGGAGSVRSGSGSTRSVHPVGSGPMGWGLGLREPPGPRWPTVPHPAPQPLPIPRGPIWPRKAGAGGSGGCSWQGKGCEGDAWQMQKFALNPKLPWANFAVVPRCCQKPRLFAFRANFEAVRQQ